MSIEKQIKDLLSEGLLKNQIAKELEVSYSYVRKKTQGISSVRPNKKYTCNKCGVTGKENFYSTTQYTCKSCWNEYTYQRSKDKILAYMEERGGAKCERCGYDKCLNALEFHHRDPTEKDPKWSRGWNITRLRKELDKCDLLCANCHREVHAEMLQ
jgi:DNA-directed RNA polymerase subunit RPC12/RpoP